MPCALNTHSANGFATTPPLSDTHQDSVQQPGSAIYPEPRCKWYHRARTWNCQFNVFGISSRSTLVYRHGNPAAWSRTQARALRRADHPGIALLV